jgi:UPF0755 protein
MTKKQKIIISVLVVFVIGLGLTAFGISNKQRATPVKQQRNSMKFLIKEGEKIEDIASNLEQKTNSKITKNSFTEYMSNKEKVKNIMKNYSTLEQQEIYAENVRYPLEGYLFPATYEISFDINSTQPTLEDVINTILEGSRDNLVPEFTKIKNASKNIHEVMTLASVVEKETPNNSESAKIAGVFYNRENANITWQSDVTLNYAFNVNQVISSGDLTKKEHPYNSYLNMDIPGPIASPGKATVNATLNPEKTDYFFFFADPDDGGKMYYNVSYEEHERQRQEILGNQAR